MHRIKLLFIYRVIQLCRNDSVGYPLQNIKLFVIVICILNFH